MKTNAGPILIFACTLLIQGCTQTPGPSATRQTELTTILKPFLKPGVLTDDYQKSPGWYEPTNRQALRNFIAKHSETEEAYQAEVWLIFASAQTERQLLPSAEKCHRAELAKRLKLISKKTSRPGTDKMAKIERAALLFAQDNSDHAEFEKQTDEILNHIREYESEKDRQFLSFLQVAEMRRSEIEPNFRLLIADEEICAHHLDKALELTKELEGKFPNWDTQSVKGQIEMIELFKRGWSPNSSHRLAEN